MLGNSSSEDLACSNWSKPKNIQNKKCWYIFTFSYGRRCEKQLFGILHFITSDLVFRESQLHRSTLSLTFDKLNEDFELFSFCLLSFITPFKNSFPKYDLVDSKYLFATMQFTNVEISFEIDSTPSHEIHDSDF